MMHENDSQNDVRLEASEKGIILWRNNVGAFKNDTGRVVRYGLANDSKQMNKQNKSSDLIGIRPVLITPAHVNTIIGQFVARECKHSEWVYTGTEREQAQLNFINIVNRHGGNACFATGRGTL